jgi:hypothetical protein
MTGDERHLMLTDQNQKSIGDSGKIDSMGCLQIPSSLEKASKTEFELAEMMAHESILSAA